MAEPDAGLGPDDQRWMPGRIVWVDLDPTRGREQAGVRPAIVMSSSGYLEAVTTLFIAVPVTTVDRGWPNHVRVEGPTGLRRLCWAMTEQPRTLSRTRVHRMSGTIAPACKNDIRQWLADFLFE